MSAVRGTRVDVSMRANESQHAQHRQCSAACPEIRGLPPNSLGQPVLKLQRSPSQAQLPRRSKEACGQPKSKREAVANVSTWGTDRWAKWEPVGATQARENDRQFEL